MRRLLHLEPGTAERIYFMARNHARLLTKIWRDPDFRRLPESAQFRYVFLISQPNLNHAGVLPLTLGRWANCSADGNAERILADLELLHERRFIVLDKGSEELLIRTFVVNDGVYKAPRVMGSMVASAQEIVSPVLRAVLLVEVGRIPVGELSEAATKRAPFTPIRTQVVALIASLRQQFGDAAAPEAVQQEPVIAVEPDPPPSDTAGGGVASKSLVFEQVAGVSSVPVGASIPLQGAVVAVPGALGSDLAGSVAAPVVGWVPEWLAPLAQAMAAAGIRAPWSFKEEVGDLGLLREDVDRVGLKVMFAAAVDAYSTAESPPFSSRWFYPRWHALDADSVTNVVPFRGRVSPQQAATDAQHDRSVRRAEERKAARLAAEAQAGAGVGV